MVQKRFLVVLSGGFDSVALLHYALLSAEASRARTGEVIPVHAVSFDYGQPHRDAELAAAQRIAERRLGAPHWERVRLTDLGTLDPEPGMLGPGVARAVVPLRNLVLLAYAGGRACRLVTDPREPVHVLYGANADDAQGFADCRMSFVNAAALAVSEGATGLANVRVGAPWVAMGWGKPRIAEWVDEQEMAGRTEVLEDVRQSVSCYRGTRCGTCDACERRATAFALAGIKDGDGAPLPMHGGDPRRAAALR